MSYAYNQRKKTRKQQIVSNKVLKRKFKCRMHSDLAALTPEQKQRAK